MLDDSLGKYPLGDYFEYFKDTKGNLSIEDILKPEISRQFAKSEERTPNFGYSRSPYWVRFKLKNDSDERIKWLIKVDYYWFTEIEFFIPGESGTFTSKKQVTYIQSATRTSKPTSMSSALPSREEKKKPFT